MADLKLDILVIPTYNVLTLGIADASTYPTDPPVVSSILTSSNLGITPVGDPLLPLPDGIWKFKYTVTPAYINFVEKTFMRTEIIQEKFDTAFMKLDMMECDRAIRTQAKVDLNSIYFFIQGSIAAANKCAVDESNRLYNQADMMLNNFIRNNCGCSGNNYINNFY